MDNLFFQHCNIFQVWILIKYIRFFAINKSNIFYLYIDVFLYSTNIFLNKKALFPNTKTLSGTMTTVTDLINAILGQQVTLELKQSITKTFCFLPECFRNLTISGNSLLELKIMKQTFPWNLFCVEWFVCETNVLQYFVGGHLVSFRGDLVKF